MTDDEVAAFVAPLTGGGLDTGQGGFNALYGIGHLTPRDSSRAGRGKGWQPRSG